jgi:histidine triad (HIT) family protein
MTEDCIFCNIIGKTISAEIVEENDELIVIRDILPKAPVHLLIIPKQHIASVEYLTADHRTLVGDLVLAAQAQARKQGVAERGYKLIWNVGPDGGQTVQHLHLHLLGGKKLE